MHVNKTRADELSLRHNNIPAAARIKVAHSGNHVSSDTDILYACGRAGSINHTAIFYKNIKHLLSPYLICQFFLS
jgi:hypothetical protein